MPRSTSLGRFAGSIPQTVLVAIVGAVLILLVTVLASRVAILMHRQSEMQLIERIGEVYLDGVSAAVAPLLDTGHRADLAAALERVAAYHDGVREVRVVVRSTGGDVLGDLARDAVAAQAKLPPVDTEVSLTTTSEENRLWVQRPLFVDDRALAVLSAQLDLKPIREERLTVALKSLAVNVLMAIGLATVGFLLMRRLLAPLNLLERALLDASEGEPRPIPLVEREAPNRRIRKLVRAYNRMARALAERRQVQIARAERLRAADLGRLAATIAHEVRNPLTGMLNAVDTARRFPDNRAAVTESLDLLDRGLKAIARVVDTTLSIWRPPARDSGVRQVDLDDLERLVRPVAERHGVRLDWSATLDRSLSLDASIIRQIVLNLVLNAVNATGSGGAISFSAAEDGAELRLVVVDDGPGLDPAVAARLERLDLDWIDTSEGGIGLGVVIRAVTSLGGAIETATPPRGGTSVTIGLPSRAPTAETPPGKEPSS